MSGATPTKLGSNDKADNEQPTGPNLTQINSSNYRRLAVGVIVLPRKEQNNWLSYTRCVCMLISNIIQIDKVVLMYLEIYIIYIIYIYIYDVISNGKKDVINFKKSKVEYVERFGGRNGKWEGM